MRSADTIAGIYRRYAGDPEFVEQIVAFMHHEPLQKGATWLLKRYLEKGSDPPDASLVSTIYASASQLNRWEARLHILQCMARLPVPDVQVKSVEAFLRECLANEIKFVRAWAYSGFRELAAQHPQFQEEATRLFEKALEQETAGSVRARLRRAIKQGFAD